MCRTEVYKQDKQDVARCRIDLVSHNNGQFPDSNGVVLVGQEE